MDVTISEVYNLNAKDELTTLIPVSEYFTVASKCKIMLWDDALQPVGEITVVKNYSYDTNVTIPEPKEMIFSDIPTNHKYYDAIYVMNKQGNIGLFHGYEDGTYRPDASMLKSEFAYSLAKMLGIQVDTVKVDCNLKDLPASHWCKNAIGFLVSNHIMDADNKYFYHNDEITLNEVLLAFLRAFGEEKVEPDTIMTLANQHKLLTNANRNEHIITRGNFAQIAYNFMNEYSK